MAQLPSVGLSCPGCARRDFWSLFDVRDHFKKEHHSLQCSVCQRYFKDELSIIQHYQKYNNPALPGTLNDIRWAIPPIIPLSSAAVAQFPQSGAFQTDAPEDIWEPPSQAPDYLHVPMIHSFHGTTPIMDGGKRPSLALSDFTSQTPVYSTVLHSLEQSLILRYLRSRCHSSTRLQSEGYILGPGSINNRKNQSKGSIPTYRFRNAPHVDMQAAPKLGAIAIDCEMVGVKHGRQTLAFLSAIDFLTGEVLISRYINPDDKVTDWRTKFSGITKAIMTTAIVSGAAFKNWREARDNLWEFMDDSTVLVGHSLNYDLEVLGIFHAKVVDSAILTAETVFPSIVSTERLTRMWSLKNLAKQLLNLDIQTSNHGHSALEDAYATRDIIIWCIRNPEELKLWAENARCQEEERKSARSRKNYSKSRSKGKLPATRSTQNWEYNTEDDGYSEDFRLSDLAEELGWPEGYDPWSD